jgi:antitoxin component of MazEF toxin-antitoxin module
MPNFRKVIKTGNSLAITIPSKTISDFSLKEGDIAQVKVNKTKTTITYSFTGHPRQLSLIDKSKHKE